MDSIQRYHIIKKLNSGGMATVFLARDGILGREVALKMLHPHLLNQKHSLLRFTNEANAIASLSHENIVKIFDYSQKQDQPFLVMEYIEGPSLSEILERHSLLPDLICLEIIQQILNGLACTHSRGIYHRDIKPANIMIHKDSTVRIMDFGIAYLVDKESITMTGSLLGSPRYISPEQVEGKILTGATDIWSTGILLYECITGQLPYEGDIPHAIINAILKEEPRNVRTVNPKALYLISDLVDKCLQRDPQNRPSAQELLQFLEKRCAQENISLGKNRLSMFLDNPNDYAVKEKRELFEICRQGALDDISRKKVASALRKFEQATFFGTLTVQDKKLLSQLSGKRAATYLKLALGSAVIVLLGVLIWLMKTSEKQLNIWETDELTVLPPPPVQKNDSTSSIIHSDSEVSKIDTPKVFTEPVTLQTPRIAPVVYKRITSEPHHKADEKSVTPENSSTIISPGFLNIQSNPPWARVIIDGIERGMTPRVRVVSLPAGEHTLELNKTGFRAFHETVIINSEDTLEFRIRLEANPSQKDSGLVRGDK